MTNDTMDEALEFLSDRGPIYGGFLSNHGPMAAEALVRLGRPDAVLPYLESYCGRLEASPAVTGRIDAVDWRVTLGRHDQFGAWQRFFEAELAEHPWRDVLETWAGRLAPGLWAALLHGLIRTGHAARSLVELDSPLRRRELADGLALWAAWYQELPDRPGDGSLSPREAFHRLPLLPEDQRGARLPLDDPGSVAGFESVAGLVDLTEPMDALSEITETYASLYVGAGLPGDSSIALIHAITGPSAVRLIAPHVSVDTQRRLLRYAWQAAAKINASWNFGAPPAEVREWELDREDVVEQAIATRDEHAIKLVEACLREHSLNPQPVYLAAAADVVKRFRV